MPKARPTLPGPEARRAASIGAPSGRAASRPKDGVVAVGHDGTNEHGTGRAGFAGHDVETQVQAVDEVDVGVAGRPPHRRVASGPPAPRMAGTILGPTVGLDLDDQAAASRPVWPGPDEPRPEECRGELIDGAREEGPRERVRRWSSPSLGGDARSDRGHAGPRTRRSNSSGMIGPKTVIRKGTMVLLIQPPMTDPVRASSIEVNQGTSERPDSPSG